MFLNRIMSTKGVKIIRKNNSNNYKMDCMGYNGNIPKKLTDKLFYKFLM
jgi:hypothetical protein